MNTYIANGMADFTIETKAALRSRIWFGFGFHLASMESEKAGKDFIAELRLAIDPGKGPAKGKASMACKTAKMVGDKFHHRFAAELASEYATPAAFVQACYMAATASGATTVAKLEDWCEHGNAEYRADKLAAENAEKEAKRAENAAVAAAELQAAIDTIDPMGFDTVVQPVVRDAAPEPEVVGESLADKVAALLAEYSAKDIHAELVAQMALAKVA